MLIKSNAFQSGNFQFEQLMQYFSAFKWNWISNNSHGILNSLYNVHENEWFETTKPIQNDGLVRLHECYNESSLLEEKRRAKIQIQKIKFIFSFFESFSPWCYEWRIKRKRVLHTEIHEQNRFLFDMSLPDEFHSTAFQFEWIWVKRMCLCALYVNMCVEFVCRRC